MNKLKKLTEKQQQVYKEGMAELEARVSADEGNEAIELQTLDKAPEMVWACTPEFKLKSNNPMIDLELTPEQTAGGVIRIIRTGSNKIKICSMVLTSHLNDGYGEAKKEAEAKKAEEAKKAGNAGRKIKLPKKPVSK